MTEKNVYAVGVSKDWIELRESATPPKLHKTEFNKQVTKNNYQHGYYDRHDQYIEGRYHVVKKLVKFTSLVYTGGKLIQTIKSKKFADLTRIQVRNGGMIQLTPEMQAVVCPALEDG